MPPRTKTEEDKSFDQQNEAAQSSAAVNLARVAGAFTHPNKHVEAVRAATVAAATSTLSATEQESIGTGVAGAAPAATSILDLPDEVKKNIVGYEDLELDEMLLRIIHGHTAPVPADRIIMQLWTQYQRSPDRAKVLARLRGLAELGKIKKMAGMMSTYANILPGEPSGVQAG